MNKLLALILSIIIIGLCLNFSTRIFASPIEDRSQDIKSPLFENALWISDDKELPDSDSLFYLDRPAPIFRKEFKPKSKIRSAILHITAAGYYKASINGEKIGQIQLDPAWTDYSKRIYYSSYDITSQLNQENNCLGVILGNGFYNPLPLKKWGRRNPRVDLSVGKPMFIGNLVIQYENGETENIITNDSWKYNYGPIIKNSVYIGTVYDARQEKKGWDSQGFADKTWPSAIIINEPGGKLQEAFFPPVQISKKITPVEITSPKKGTYIVDMGVNFTGTYNIKLSGNLGDTITFRFGERIYEDGNLNPMTTVIGQVKKKGVGGPGSPEIAWQTDRYIIGENNHSWFEPDFTYHVYRYIEILGLKQAPKLSDIEGLVIHSNVKNIAKFSTSSKLLNDIQEITERTFLSNLVSVQSDCAAREKFGYGGDLNATSESFIMNYDMEDFYRKTVYDWVDAMNDSTFVDTAPFAGVKYCGISWESAFLTTQYYLYLYYNNTDIIRELYTMDKEWMDKVAIIHPEGMVKRGLSDHESLEPVPVELTGTAHYLQCAEIMETFATLMNDSEQAKKYNALASKLRNLIKNKFWDKAVTDKINRQTLFSTLLYHNIIPQNELETAKDSLLNALHNGPAGHLNTGIFGTKYMLEVVSKYISPDEIFQIANSTSYPGWGFMIDQGATTIWETWKESDNTFSNNHPMFGSITEWFYRWLGGIQPHPEHPGFEQFILSPFPPEGLNSVNSQYNSPYGTIISNWEQDSNRNVTYNIVIPPKSIAHVKLQMQSSQTIKVLKGSTEITSAKIPNLQTGSFPLNEGSYTIIVKSN